MRSALLPLACGAILGAAAVYLADTDNTPPASGTAASSSAGGVTAGETAPSGATPLTAPASTALVAPLAPATSGSAAATGDSGGTSAIARRQAGLATLAELGNDEAALARVLATLPPADRMAFRIDALAALAERDPAGALRGALALDVDAARRLAVERLAATVARLDPTRALAQAALIDNRELESLYLSSAAGAWAEGDARAALAWLASAVPQTLSAAAAATALDAIALADVDALLASLDGLPPTLQPVARRSALVALVERDPAAALAAVEAVPPGRNRNELEIAVAERYALVDTDAAVAWAMQRQSRSTVLRGALLGAAANDYERAVDLLLDVLPTESNSGIATALIESPFGDFARVADRLRAASDPAIQARLGELMTLWPQYDAEAALRWAIANVDAGAALLGSIAGWTGRHRPELAIAAAEGAPPELRDRWIAAVAAGLAEADPERALAFLERHRGEPSYDSGLANVVEAILPVDPRRAAQLVEHADTSSAVRNRAIGVAFQWAQRDLAAAAEWAAGLDDDPPLQTAAVMNVAGVYASRDPGAALDWVLGLPEGQGRDLGLQLVADGAAASSVTLSERALEAIGNDDMRANGAVRAAVAIGREDPDAARRFADKWIGDPRLRREAEQRIAEQRGGTDAASFIGSMVDLPR